MDRRKLGNLSRPKRGRGLEPDGPIAVERRSFTVNPDWLAIVAAYPEGLFPSEAGAYFCISWEIVSPREASRLSWFKRAL